jgi:pimeloyl-ACP methyl ester carboxylesterase
MVKTKKGHRRYWFTILLFVLSALLLTAISISAFLAQDRAMTLVHPSRSLAERTPSDVGMDSWSDVSFLSSDNLQLSAWFIPVEGEESSPTLIFVHGLGSNREELLDQAKLLYDYGYSALLLDLRNHGQSQGEITSLGYQEVLDIEGAVDYLMNRPEVDRDRIGLVGHSMGGAVVIRAAARISQVKATIAESAFTSIEDNISQGVRQLTGLPPFPFAPMVIWFGEREAGAKIQLVRPIDDLSQISPRAIMFIHGELDPLVDMSNSQRLYEAAKEPKALYLIPDAGHGGLMEAEPEEFENQVIAFLDRYFK